MIDIFLGATLFLSTLLILGLALGFIALIIWVIKETFDGE